MKKPLPPPSRYKPAPTLHTEFDEDWRVMAYARDIDRIHRDLDHEAKHGPVRVIYSRSEKKG